MTRIAWLSLAVVLAIASVLRLLRLDAVNYWFDESFSILMAQFSVPEIISRCGEDTHPPLSFLVLKPWLAISGTNPWFARLSSVGCGLGAVAGVWGFTWAVCQQEDRLRQQAAAIAGIAALLAALSPLQLTWSQQVRMYSATALLTVLSSWSFWRCLISPDRKANWVVYGVLMTAALYVHVTMLLLFAAHVTTLGLMTWRNRRAPDGRRSQSLLCNGIIGILIVSACWSPWVMVLFRQQARVQADFWSRPLDADNLGDTLIRAFTVSEAESVNPQVGLWIGQGLVLLVLALAAGKRPSDRLLALSIGAGVLGPIALSIWGRNIVSPRYLIGPLTLLCMAVPLLLARLPSSAFWPLSILAITGQAIQARDYHIWRAKVAGSPGVRSAVELWEINHAEGEPLLFCNPMPFATAQVYRPNNPSLRVVGNREDFPFFVGTAILRPEDCISLNDIEESDALSVWTCDWGWRETYLEPVSLDSSWQLVSETPLIEFNGSLFLRRYERRPQPDREQL